MRQIQLSWIAIFVLLCFNVSWANLSPRYDNWVLGKPSTQYLSHNNDITVGIGNEQGNGKDFEFHGFVGLPVDEHPPWGRCYIFFHGPNGEDSRFANQAFITWTFGWVSIESGQLPPGLSMDSDGNISGVPQRAGTWHLRVQFHSLKCKTKDFGDFVMGDRYINLHIKTEGSSVPQSVR